MTLRLLEHDCLDDQGETYNHINEYLSSKLITLTLFLYDYIFSQ